MLLHFATYNVVIKSQQMLLNNVFIDMQSFPISA